MLTSDQVRKEGITEEAIDSNGQKFCADCKHLLGVRYKDDTEKWRCLHPNNLLENREETDLVLGIKKYIRIYGQESLYFLRESPRHCGKEGKWFEHYEEPDHSTATIGGKDPVELEIFDDATLKANREKAAERMAAIKAKGKLSKDDLSNL